VYKCIQKISQKARLHYPSGEKLPKHNTKAENVCLEIIWFVFNHLDTKGKRTVN
jgi:hypothetical protein